MSKLRDEERATLRERLAKMDRQEKISYIWNYYKVHFGVALLLVGLVAMTATDMYRNWVQRDYVHVAVIEQHYYKTKDYMDRVVKEGGWEEPLVYQSFLSAMDTRGDGMMQIATFLSTNEVEIIICDAESLYYFLESGISLETDIVVPLLGTQLEENIGGEDLCLLVLRGEERSDKAEQVYEILKKYT